MKPREIRNPSELVAFLMPREGKKSQIKRGDMKEVVGILSDAFYANPALLDVFLKNGKRRFRRNKGARS